MQLRSKQLVQSVGASVGNELPPFPVDDQTLDMLWTALNPDWNVHDRSSLNDFLDLMSQLGGSDTRAVERTVENPNLDESGPAIVFLRDQLYSHHDVISALIEEVRRLRAAMSGPKHP